MLQDLLRELDERAGALALAVRMQRSEKRVRRLEHEYSLAAGRLAVSRLRLAAAGIATQPGQMQ